MRAKFKVESITEHASGDKTAHLIAVCADSPENSQFHEFTPMGSLEIGISANAQAKDYLVPGKEYYLDFRACS